MMNNLHLTDRRDLNERPCNTARCLVRSKTVQNASKEFFTSNITWLKFEIAQVLPAHLSDLHSRKMYVGKLWFVPALNARRAQERLGI
jgi:hypothetical protein